MKKVKVSLLSYKLFLSIFLTLFFNKTFFEKVLEIYTFKSVSQSFFILSLIIVLFSVIFIVLSLLLQLIHHRILAVVILFFSTGSAFIMDSYKVMIDKDMFLNGINTDHKELSDLFNFKLFLYILFLFIVPLLCIFHLKIKKNSFLKNLKINLRDSAAALSISFALIAGLSKYYASFFREHKIVRCYTNPTFWIYSIGKFFKSSVYLANTAFTKIGEDARVLASDPDRELIIIVVGETARSDRFSLNGYHKKTNPYLERENIVSFSDVRSCGTSTAISVPCMFSNLGEKEYSTERSKNTENLLDVLAHTGDVDILWRDNNSTSKGVADRVHYQDFQSPEKNTVCDEECRDVGMLVGLEDYINASEKKDIVIVLHQMGSHGPAYFKRYPKEFEKFIPACHTNELSECSQEEIDNAYDNTILYTDYFLSRVIELLKKQSVQFDTAMIYLSDHGESLGENSIYLHGLPNVFAPNEQRKVPMIMWFGGNMEKETDYDQLNKIKSSSYSHDNFFHTVLGTMEINSESYDPAKDILAKIHTESMGND